jgi:hypothetical protein
MVVCLTPSSRKLLGDLLHRMLRVIAARAAAPALRRGIPSFAVRLNQQNSGPGHGSSGMFADDDAVRRRLLYRSKMRGAAASSSVPAVARLRHLWLSVAGWLEMDIMLGKWVRCFHGPSVLPRPLIPTVCAHAGCRQPARAG